jgi:hypothetical protein
MNFSSKITQVLDVLEDQTTSGDIIHARQFHARIPPKLIKNGPLPFVPLRNYNAGISSANA